MPEVKKTWLSLQNENILAQNLYEIITQYVHNILSANVDFNNVFGDNCVPNCAIRILSSTKLFISLYFYMTNSGQYISYISVGFFLYFNLKKILLFNLTIIFFGD